MQLTMVLFIVCVLVWLPILIYQIDRRGFLLLLAWLLIAPVAENVITEPTANPFFRQQPDETMLRRMPPKPTYTAQSTTIKLTDLMDPTRLLLGAFFVVLLFEAAFRNHALPLDRVEKWMCLFSIIVIVGALRSIRVLFSIRVAIDAFIMPFLAYYISRRLITSEHRLRQLTQVICIVGCYIIMIALIERLGSSALYYRLGATFKNHFSLSCVMSTVFLIMLADTLRGVYFPDEKPTLPRSARWFALYLAPVIVLLTWTRGLWLGFLASAGIFLFLSRRLTSPSRKLALVGLVLIFLSVATYGLQAPALQTITQERVTERTGTVYARIGAWMIAFQEIAKEPLLGIGLNDLQAILETTQIRVMGTKSETHSHNSFLSIFAELGLIGFLTYLGLVISMLQIGLRLYRSGLHVRDRWLGVTIVGVIVAYLMPALFANTLYTKGMHQVYVYAFIGGIAGLYGQRLLGPKLYIRSERHPPASTGTPVIVR